MTILIIDIYYYLILVSLFTLYYLIRKRSCLNFYYERFMVIAMSILIYLYYRLEFKIYNTEKVANVIGNSLNQLVDDTKLQI